MTENENVESIMKPNVLSVQPSASLRSVIELMVKHDIGSVPVTENGEPVGIFTERDALRLILKMPDLLEKPVRDVMTTKLVTAEPEMSLIVAFDTMSKNKIRRLPVVREGKLIGIVTERDLREWILKVSAE